MTALRLTLGFVADAVGGEFRGERGREVGGVTTDSRSLAPGDLFVALRGERFDGHEFVDDALATGAVGAIVEHGWMGERRREAELIAVQDTTRALQELAHAVRKSVATRVVAITGSAGKTTTKETIAEFLSARFRVVRNRGNLNNHIGLPLSLMQLREEPDVAVMELGMNHAGEISTLVAIAEPDVRVWTNVGDAHLGFFPSPDAIADAKAEILEGAAPNTLLVFNADDPLVAARAASFRGRVLTFGLAPAASVRAVDIEDRGISGMRARVITPAGDARLDSPLLGRGNLMNVLAATAVALDFDVPLDEVADRTSRLSASDRRGAVHRLRDGIVLIDDSYNSSPSALMRALEVVAAERRFEGRVAVLGEMLELGDHAASLHEQAGRVAAASGLRRLVAIGADGARALAAAAHAAAPDLPVDYFETSERAAGSIAAIVRARDLVLVKGSRGIRTDAVADRIKAEFA